MRILFIGDVVGTPGVNLVRRAVPILCRRESLDVVIANAENAASGSGLTIKQYHRLRDAGVDLITLGDHVYRKGEIIPLMLREDRICKPANFPPESPGSDFASITLPDGTIVTVVSVLGRTFMRPVDCPFHACDRVLNQLKSRGGVIFVDVHAEATADKYLLAHYLKGRVSAVLGTHTHVPTADEQILPPGTAFICDVGMTGPYDSILGRRIDRVLSAAVTFEPTPFDVASEDVRLAGAIVEIDPVTRRASRIERITFFERELGVTIPHANSDSG